MPDELRLFFATPARLFLLALPLMALAVWAISIPVQRRYVRRLFGRAAGLRGSVWWALIAESIALLLVAIALADPRAGPVSTDVARPRLQLVIVLDRSRSMLVQDVGHSDSRIDVGKRLVDNVLAQAGGAPVALVTFAGSAELDVPLTRDHLGLQRRLADLSPARNPLFGSNLRQAIDRAAQAFARPIAGRKMLVILTDGETTSPVDDAMFTDLPSEASVQLVVLGNAERGGKIPVGATGQFLTYEEQVVRSRAAPEPMRELARSLDAAYWHVEDSVSLDEASESLEAAVQSAARPPALDDQMMAASRAKPLFRWLVIAALGVLTFQNVSAWWPNVATLWRQREAFSRAAVVGLVGLIGLSQLGADRPDEPAADAIQLLSYRQRVIQYNDAVAAYRRQEYQAAESGFRPLMDAQDPALGRRATFNLANTRFRSVASAGDGRSGRMNRQEAIGRLTEAIRLYRTCIERGHRPRDAAANIRLTEQFIEQIRKQTPQPSDQSGQPSDRGSDSPDSPAPSPPSNGDDQDSGNSQPPPPGGGARRDGRNNPGSAHRGDRDGGSEKGPGNPGSQSSGAGSGSGQGSEGGPNAQPAPMNDQQAEEMLRRARRRASRRATSRPDGTDPDSNRSSAAGAGENAMPW